MADRTFNITLGDVDFESLRTEDDIRALAKGLVPTALEQIGQTIAGAMWETLGQVFTGPGFQPNNSEWDKRQFIEEAGRKHAEEASPEDRQELEDFIVARLTESKNSSSCDRI